MSITSKLDANQVLREVYDGTTKSLKTSSPAGAATEQLQQDQLAELQSINQNIQDLEITAENININTDTLEALVGTTNNKIDSSNTKLDTLISNTDNVETLQTSTNTKLDTIITHVDGIETNQNNQTTELQNISSKSTLMLDKTAAGLIVEKHDNIEMAYIGSTTNIDTVTYKLGVTTVATLTMTYDGNGRLTNVVKS